MSAACQKQGLRSPSMAIPPRSRHSALHADEDALVRGYHSHELGLVSVRCPTCVRHAPGCACCAQLSLYRCTNVPMKARHALSHALVTPQHRLESSTDTSLLCPVQLIWHSAVDHHRRPAAAVRSGGPASSGSSAATQVSAASSLSRQSSTSGLQAGALRSPEPLGSWAGRQTSFPVAAQHLPVKVRL